MSSDSFSLSSKVAIITGGYGVLGGSIAQGLASAGARIAILGRRHERAEQKVAELRKAGADARALIADVLDEKALDAVRDELLAEWGRIDILVNAAGGNVPRARNDNRPVFEVAADAFDEVMRLNADGNLSARAQAILAQTPMGRFGKPEEVNAAVQWLSSDAASFVTGVVIPIDGGFSAFSGV
jgi:NAD(P)-dependent dehydrogenase (short-subunit alcohol dehydrogenase family)